MAGPFGQLFAPTGDVAQEAQQQRAQLKRSSRPLQVVSLNLPTTLSPRAPVSRTLLEPAPNVGGVDPDKAVLASILRATMGQGAVLPPRGLTAPAAMVAPAGAGGWGDDGAQDALQAPRPPAPSPIRQVERDPGPFTYAPQAPANQNVSQQPEFVGDVDGGGGPFPTDEGSSYTPDALNAFFGYQPSYNFPGPQMHFGENEWDEVDDYGTPTGRKTNRRPAHA